MGLKTEMTLISFLQANQYEFTASIEFKSVWGPSLCLIATLMLNVDIMFNVLNG